MFGVEIENSLPGTERLIHPASLQGADGLSFEDGDFLQSRLAALNCVFRSPSGFPRWHAAAVGIDGFDHGTNQAALFLGELRPPQISNNRITRVWLLRFQASCSMVSSKTHALPSSQE